MNTLTYSQKLRNPKWQKKRLEILQRDKFTCQLCLDTETELQIHHKEYLKGKEPWEYEGYQLTSLCKHCHGYVSNTAIYPHYIFKKIIEDEVFLIILDETGLSFSYPVDYRNISVSHDTLKILIQQVINYWLMQGQENNLVDHGRR